MPLGPISVLLLVDLASAFTLRQVGTAPWILPGKCELYVDPKSNGPLSANLHP